MNWGHGSRCRLGPGLDWTLLTLLADLDRKYAVVPPVEDSPGQPGQPKPAEMGIVATRTV